MDLIRKHSAGDRVLRCTLCGAEICSGEDYWYCNGTSVCRDCLADYARRELAPYRQVRGREGDR